MLRFLYNVSIIFASSSIAFINPSLAAERKVYSGEVAAKYTKLYIDHHGTVGAFLKTAEPFFDKKQMVELKRSMSSVGLDLKSKFPEVKVEGNKIYFDKNNYMIYEDGSTININGVKFSKTGEPIDAVFQKIYKQISKTSASRFELIPEAHAFGILLALLAIVGVIGIGALVMHHGGGSTAAPDGGDTGDAGGVYTAAEAGSSDNSAHCYGKGYIIRENRGGRFVSNKMVAVSRDAISRACADPMHQCTKQTLSDVRSAALDPSWKSPVKCEPTWVNSFTVHTPPADVAPDTPAPDPAVDTPAPPDNSTPNAEAPADDLPVIDD